ncbi:MAG: hypothetical protein QXF23_01085 [Candidatus Bathyarchaeia archaeon]
MNQENLFKIIGEVLAQIALEVTLLLPKILITLVVFIIAFLIIRMLNAFLGKLLKIAKVDDAFVRFSGFSLPFSLEKFIVFLANIGIILIAFYATINLFLEPRYIQLINDGIYYGARIISIIIITLVIFAVFNAVTIRTKVDPRIRTYPLVIIMLLVTAMLIDITALSSEIKGALAAGLSIGVGVAIGAFALWFFFHEYLDAYFKTGGRVSEGAHK